MDGCVIDFLAPEHVASFVSWLAFAAPRDVTGNVFVVHGTAIELPRMDAERRHVRSDAGTDAELLRLRDRLFDDSATSRLPDPVSALFQFAS
jgi:hypothetical protein